MKDDCYADDYYAYIDFISHMVQMKERLSLLLDFLF